jgi:hypothetical protein
MKRRWQQNREGMLKKIREGVWRWLLDMEPCGCKCCKECLRCRTELALKNGEANELEKEKQQHKRSHTRKKGASKEQNKPSRAQIKSPRGQNKRSKKQRNSSRDSDKPPRPTPKAENPRLRRPESTRKPSFFVRILKVIKKWKEVISGFLKRLWKQAGLDKVGLLKLSQKVSKTLVKRSKTAGLFCLLPELWRLLENEKSTYFFEKKHS